MLTQPSPPRRLRRIVEALPSSNRRTIDLVDRHADCNRLAFAALVGFGVPRLRRLEGTLTASGSATPYPRAAAPAGDGFAGYPAAQERAIVETMHALDLVGTRRRTLGDRLPPAWLRLLGRIAGFCVALPACGTPGVGLLGDQDADVRDEVSATDAIEEADGDRSCTFTVDETSDGGTVTCRIEPGSLAACTDVAECICRARSPTAERVRIDECIGRELTPRAMITLSDFCPGAPARYDLDEALRGYYGSLGAEDHLWVSAGCAAIPALAGSAPYAECVMLSGFYCPCIPGICDADILVRRRCADLSRDQVLCIYAGVTEDRDRACELDIAAIVADCIDPAT